MGILQISSFFASVVLISACAHAEPSQKQIASQAPTRLILGQTGVETTLTEALAAVKPGSIVVIGENHNKKVNQAQQLEIMKTLRALGHRVSVGMEFLRYPDQPLVNQYRAGQLSEADFLKAVWGGDPYDLYRDQILFPNAKEGSFTVALNIPLALKGRVSKVGIEGLTPEEAALLPPRFQVGRDSYKERFVALMPHLPPDSVSADRYFAAQSVWDDTMAWKAVEFLRLHPKEVLVIVAGEFHVQYGGGLPDRLRVRAPQIPVLTLVQFNTFEVPEDVIRSETEVSAKYGARADYIWLAPAQ